MLTSPTTITTHRAKGNPLITPQMIVPTAPDWEVLGVFNAGVTQHEGETVLLLRVAERPKQTVAGRVRVPVLNAQWLGGNKHAPRMSIVELDSADPGKDFSDPRVVRDLAGRTLYLTSISHLRVARSRDGFTFEIDDKATVLPENEMESWGIEDARITQLEGVYYSTYSAISSKGVAVGMLSSRDLAVFEREGLLLAPTNKDVAIFPEKIDGKYWMLHRPVPEGIGEPEMWLAASPDLLHWGDHRFLMGLRPCLWDSARIGAGCVPIHTEAGWLILYHGANAAHSYCMGAALLDLHEPWKVLARLEEPFLKPEAEYETNGFFRNVIFSCGALVREDTIFMYYGASDDTIALATFSIRELLERLLGEHKKGRG